MKRIRGHHLYCMTLFSGHGYDEAFAKNMVAVIAALQAGEEFCLCAGQDDLCALCPNREEGGGCSLGTEDVLYRDQAAFRVLGLEEEAVLTWDMAARRLGFAGADGFRSVCRECRWKKENICTIPLLLERLS